MKKIVAVMVMVVFFLAGAHAYAEEEGAPFVFNWTDQVTLSGAIEVEAGFSEDFEGNDSSDIALATVELGVEAELNEWFSGQIIFLWEEDDTEPVDLDQGFITLGGTEAYPVFLTAGKIYVPFGRFESNMISDPLTLEIGETRESAVQAGFDYNGFQGSVYTFKGDIIKAGDDDKINAYGANIAYVTEKDDFCLEVGADYISNLFDSDGLQDVFAEAEADYTANAPGADPSYELNDFVGGYALYAVVDLGPASFVCEFVGGADDPEYLVDNGNGKVSLLRADTPEAFHVEGAYVFEAMTKEIILAATYQTTDNLAGVLPETRYGGSCGVAMNDMLGVALEYLHDEDYDIADGGTGNSGDSCTLQLALGF
ncbi:MAG: LbtU family siderophore porin [Desulfobacterales bacterium]|nr:LbtU family siderophore porin [Desulfobacterales bacterium]